MEAGNSQSNMGSKFTYCPIPSLSSYFAKVWHFLRFSGLGAGGKSRLATLLDLTSIAVCNTDSKAFRHIRRVFSHQAALRSSSIARHWIPLTPRRPKQSIDLIGEMTTG